MRVPGFLPGLPISPAEKLAKYLLLPVTAIIKNTFLAIEDLFIIMNRTTEDAYQLFVDIN